jgi:hypothetical protein
VYPVRIVVLGACVKEYFEARTEHGCTTKEK